MAIDEIRFQGYNKLTDYLRNDRTGHIMENEFVRLYQSTNRLQAEMIVDNLKHNGINSYYKSEGADEIMQLSAGMSFMGDSVYVRRADIGKAQTVLKDFLNASGVKPLAHQAFRTGSHWCVNLGHNNRSGYCGERGAIYN